VSNLLDSGPQRNVRSLLPALSNIDFALNAADRGFVPFPLEVNSAEPAFDEGDALATKSKVMLRHWWDEKHRLFARKLADASHQFRALCPINPYAARRAVN
jgi:hypothetical protein